jgi:hypothetical protein
MSNCQFSILNWAEYRLFVEVGDLVPLLQVKARRYLSEYPA